MYCQKCGKQIPDSAIFCTYFGNAVSSSENSSVINETIYDTDYTYRRKAAKTRHFIFWLPVWVFGVVLLIAYSQGKLKPKPVMNQVDAVQSATQAVNSEDAVKETNILKVKTGLIPTYSNNVTVGDAFEKFFADPKWEATEDSGIQYVSFQGQATNAVNNTPEDITILFSVTGNKFSIVSWKADGKKQSMEELPAMLHSVFEEGEK